MEKKKVRSTVILKCKLDKIQEFKIAVAKLVNETVKESGCEVFKIFQNDDKPDEFTLWEIFRDEAALDIHMKSPHTQECFNLDLFEIVSITHHTEAIE